jgi:hypothetical protein
MLKTININSAAVAVLAVAAFAHTPRIESDDVNRAATHCLPVRGLHGERILPHVEEQL